MEILAIFKSLSDELNKNKEKLNELDGATGDADFGSNITRGFNEVIKKGQTAFTASTSLCDDLKTVGLTLMSKVGGSSGILVGRSVMCMGKAVDGKTQLKNSDIGNMLRTGINEMTKLGKAVPGDKTLIDALDPAARAFESASDSEPLAFAAAAVAARKGAESTTNRVSKKGRSSYLGDRSKGHMDAGSCAVALIFEKLASMKI